MATELTWLGHGSWSIRAGDKAVLLDPFLDESPTSPVKAADVECDFILISHGHFDHVADAASIAKRTGATIIANYEITQWFAAQHGLENAIGMNIGGGVDLPFGRVKLTPAWHTSMLPDGANGGVAGGFLLTVDGASIYFACDTGLFLDMKLIGAGGVDVAILPIGDLFTMGPDDALEAVRLIEPQRVIPDHFGTWPPIEQDPAQWAERVRDQTSAEPIVLEPGGVLTV